MAEMTARRLFTRLKGEDVICLAPPISSEESLIDEVVGIVHDAVKVACG